MSKQIPYFKFFSGEWLLGRISDENYRVQGLFISACSFYWHKECVITTKELSKKLGKTNVKLLQDLDYLSEENDQIIIKFLDEQYSEFENLREKRSNAGRKGGQANVKQTLSKSEATVKHLDVDIDIEKDKYKTAYEYLVIEKPSDMEVFEMQYRKQLNDFDKFKDWFNADVESLDLDFNANKLFGKLKKLAISFKSRQPELNEETEGTPTRMRKPNVRP